jgi:hypothetical protein
VIKVKNNIKIKINNILIETNISIIIHLGKNPKNGGSPPKESKLVKIIKLIKKFLFFIRNV